MADLLDMAYINSLPQPLFANLSGTWWPVNDIDVESGLLRLDIIGLLQVEHIGGVRRFRDADGDKYSPDDFYTDADREDKTP